MNEKAGSAAMLPTPTPNMLMGEEEGRAFLQQRIALYSKVVFLLSLFFYVFGNALELLHPERTLWGLLSHPPNLAHLAAALVGVLAWLGTRARALSYDFLRAIDSGQVLLAMALYALMASLSIGPPEARVDLLMALILMLVLTARSIIVPSTPRQTFLLGLATSLIVMVPGWLFGKGAPPVPGITISLHLLAYLALWCGSAVAVSTLASRVIFGLRLQVAEAHQLGQYLLGEKIGEGGMGAVYKARHALLRRPTAIKLLLSGRAGAIDLSRFEREVQLTSSLTHPNTVAIFDYGRTPDGVFYYAMEYLDGLDLDRLVELDGPQSPARVVHILEQVAGALAEAHGVGLVHRDIKPANIILCERGGVPDVAKVVDFGLVKDVSSNDPALSNVDSIIGTPLFIAPEALLSPETVDARSDLYALGGVAYYLLTGTPMFVGTLMEVCGQHLHSVPERPSERLGRALPADLEALVMACLEKDPARRPQTARELGKALAACAVPRWSEDDARAWWNEHRRAASGDQERRTAAGSRSGPAMTLTVDVRQRAATA